MEAQELPFNDGQTTSLNSSANHLSTVDTSRPFRSVKEAVAIFGERFLAQEIYTPKPFFTIPKHETITHSPLFSSPSPSSSSFSPTDHDTMKDSLKKLEAELKETKRELDLLKERESETEIALASLNAELHKNMSKMAEAESKSAREKASMLATRSTSTTQNHQVIKGKTEEEAVETMYLKSLAEVLRLGDKDGYFGEKKTKLKKNKKMEKEKEMMNKKKLKPIIPLVGDLLSWKKKHSSSSNYNLDNPLYTSDPMYFN